MRKFWSILGLAFVFIFNTHLITADSIAKYMPSHKKVELNSSLNFAGFKFPKIKPVKPPKAPAPKSLPVKSQAPVKKVEHNVKKVENNPKKDKKQKNAAPKPDPKAEGTPHTIIERPGPKGQYTTHKGDGLYKQYRGEGKPHGNEPRPNIKENTMNNECPTGPRPNSGEIRGARPDEIPKE